jgi:hypothetical protein
MNPEGYPTELPRQISFFVFRVISEYWLSSKTSFFIPFHPISFGLRVLDPLKTECKYEGLLSEMQIEKELRD